MNVKVKLERKLAEKYKKRSFDIRKGDTVKIVRGDFKGNEGKVNEVRDGKLLIEKVTLKKADGSMIPGKMDPSNVIITKFDLTDALRRGKLGVKKEPKEAKAKEPKAKEAKAKEAKAKEAKENEEEEGG
jgi:large subunit ribosomal protein L24